MPELKILCTADLHLGRSSAGVSAEALLDPSSLGAWDRIVRAAIVQGASAVAIAGDVFDGMGSYYEVRDQFRVGLRQLGDAGIPIVAVAGNHDWEALPRFAKQYPNDNLVFLGDRGEWETKVISTKDGEISFVGWSFPAESAPKSSFDSFPTVSANRYVVGLVHGEVSTRSKYHPIAVSDFDRGADAWVVGHIHAPQLISPKSLYPGSPQALDFGPGERGPHGYRWLHLNDSRVYFSDLEPVSTVRFHECALDIPCLPSDDPWEELMAVASEEASRLRSEQTGLQMVHLRVRATFTGLCVEPEFPASPELSPDGRSSVAVLSVAVRPDLDLKRLSGLDDAVGQAARLLLGATDGSPDAHPSWVADVEQIVAQGAEDVIRHFKATIAATANEDETAPLEPTAEQAKELAREALIQELELMLGSFAAKEMAG